MKVWVYIKGPGSHVRGSVRRTRPADASVGRARGRVRGRVRVRTRLRRYNF